MKERAIIAQTLPPRDWDSSAADIITDPAELYRRLALDPASLPASLAAGRDFPFKVPASFVRRMRPGDASDPLLLQVLGQAAELEPAAGFSNDPLDEAAYTPLPGILHKYPGRVLLMVTGACAIHCRYCFRRHFPYQDHLPGGDRQRAMLDWLAARADIHEVILSGGDPLSLSDRRLRDWCEALSAIPPLRRLRLHSRLPVVMPERISEGLLSMLSLTRLTSVMVIHANHAAELDHEVGAALAALRAAGVQLLNQAVLLRQVNDNLPALMALSERLAELQVQPYYLHQLDAVAGAAHFAVTDERAVALVAELRARLPGYLVPTLVREVPGATAKRPLMANGLELSG